MDLRKPRKWLAKHGASTVLVLAVLMIFTLTFGDKILPVWKENELKPIYGAETQEKVGAVVCNIYWGTEYVPDILKALKERDIKATFFIGGMWANDNPEVLKQIVSDGHEIGSHGYSHKMHSKLSLDENVKEMEKAANAIEPITGTTISLFMPPSGDFGQATLQAAKQLNYKTIMWSCDTIDWRDQQDDVLLGRVQKKMAPGGIILTHPTAATARIYGQMLDYLTGQGYRLCPVGELIATED